MFFHKKHWGPRCNLLRVQRGERRTRRSVIQGFTRSHASLSLSDRDFVNATLMTPTFEIGLEERTHDIQCFRCGDESGREREYVRVVMLTCELSQLGVPAECGTDALVLVGSHRDTVTGGADDDTELELALLDSVSEGVSVIRIVATLGAVASEILHCGSVVLQEQLHLLLERKPCVVRRQRNTHFAKTFHINSNYRSFVSLSVRRRTVHFVH